MERKSKVITITLYEEELDLLQQIAEATGMNRSEIIRSIIARVASPEDFASELA